METLSFVNTFLKYIFITAITFYIFFKATNYSNVSKKDIFLLLFSSIGIALLYTILLYYISPLIILSLFIIIISMVLSYIKKLNLDATVILSFISVSISIACFIISLALSIVIALFIGIDKESSLILLFSILIEILLVNRLFHIPRFKHGFSFLNRPEKINIIRIVGLIFLGLLIITYSFSQNSDNYNIRLIMLFRICPYHHWYFHLDKKKYYIRLSR